MKMKSPIIIKIVIGDFFICPNCNLPFPNAVIPYTELIKRNQTWQQNALKRNLQR